MDCTRKQHIIINNKKNMHTSALYNILQLKSPYSYTS